MPCHTKPTIDNWFVALPGQLRGHGCLLPAAPDVHQRSRDQELLGEVHQLHTGLHLHVQQRERTPTPHCFPHTATPLPHPQFKLLEELYSTTLETLRETRNERLWFKTNTKVWGVPRGWVGWLPSNCLFIFLHSWESYTLTVETLCVWRQ